MNRRIVLVVLAVVLALAGTGVVYAYVKHADNRAIADVKSDHVLIVKTQIPAGTHWSDVAKGDYVRQETVPATAAPADAISSVDAAIDGSEVSSAVIQPGQLLVREMFGDQATVTGVLAIPKGMVAISVSLSNTAAVAGYVQPQSRVAIFLTFQLTGANATNIAKQLSLGNTTLSATKLLLSNVQVIATSSAAPTDVTRGGSGGSSVLTLALSQQDAERIILAQTAGQLYLGLMSKDSDVSTSEGGVTNVGRVVKPAPIFVK
jgi:pilus assembly protein CpaB